MATLPKTKKYAPKMERTTADILRDVGRAASQGLTFGFADEIEALIRSSLPEGKSYEEEVAAIRSSIDAFRESDPVLAYGSEIFASMVTAGGLGVAGARLGLKGIEGAARMGTAEGLAYGAGTGETEAERLTGMAVGAPLGLALGVAGESITPRLSQAAKEMIKGGYKLTPGQALGGAVSDIEQSISLPFVKGAITEARQRPIRQFRLESFQKAVDPIGVKISKNQTADEMFDQAQQAVSDAYENIVPKLSINVAPVDKQINEIISNRLQQKVFSPDDASEFNKIVADVYTRNVTDGTLSKQMLKDTESDITKEIGNLMKPGAPARDRRLGRALKEAQDALREEISRQNPDVPDLQKVNQAFRNLRPLERAVKSARSAEGGFTPIQLRRALESEGFKRTSPEVLAARQAGPVIGPSVGTSQTAERLLSSSIPGYTAGGLASTVLGPAYATSVGRGLLRRAIQTPGTALRTAAPSVAGLLGEPAVQVSGDLLGIGEARAEPGRIRYESGVDRAGNPYTMAIDTATGQATRVR